MRDHGSKVYGCSLRDARITPPKRTGQPLLILAIACLLLCGVGAIAKGRFRPSARCSTNRPRQCSLDPIGLIMRARMQGTPQQGLAAVRGLSEAVAPNRG